VNQKSPPERTLSVTWLYKTGRGDHGQGVLDGRSSFSDQNSNLLSLSCIAKLGYRLTGKHFEVVVILSEKEFRRQLGCDT